MSTIIRVPLHSGKHPDMVAEVDGSDFDLILPYRWNVVSDGQTFYAVRSITVTPRPHRKTTTVRMHRLILGVPDNMVVDHIDGNGLNNTRGNLRICHPADNVRYRRISKNNTTGFTGVSFARDPRLTCHWKATIRFDGRLVHLGYFASAEEAALAFDEAARGYRGVFARLNFPRIGEQSA